MFGSLLPSFSNCATTKSPNFTIALAIQQQQQKQQMAYIQQQQPILLLTNSNYIKSLNNELNSSSNLASSREIIALSNNMNNKNCINNNNKLDEAIKSCSTSNCKSISRVIHLRNIPSDMTELELVNFFFIVNFNCN